jgi:hypothetical protein
MYNGEGLKKCILDYLSGGHAHKTLQEAVRNFPIKHINSKPEHVPYTFWYLLEHIRITQQDILLFIRNSNYKYIDWPKDYWPQPDSKADQAAWDRTLAGYEQDLQLIKKNVKNPKIDLLARIPHSEGQSYLHEILLVIDHCSYHVGEFILMRRALNIWKDGL